MDITLNEALIVLLMNRDDADATNAIPLMRFAQHNLIQAAGGRAEVLHTPRDPDDADDIIATVTRNGALDIFTELV